MSREGELNISSVVLSEFFKKAKLPHVDGKNIQNWEQVSQASKRYASEYCWSPSIKKRIGCPPLPENESLKRAVMNYILY